METKFQFDFDDVVKDIVSGLTGKIVCMDIWRNGCKRCGVQPEGTHEGKAYGISWIDEGQLELIEKTDIEAVVKDTGGPFPEPGQSDNDPGL